MSIRFETRLRQSKNDITRLLSRVPIIKSFQFIAKEAVPDRLVKSAAGFDYVLKIGLKEQSGKIELSVPPEISGQSEEAAALYIPVLAMSNGEVRFVEGLIQKQIEYSSDAGRDCADSNIDILAYAPYISETSGALLRKAGYSYLDGAGNCWISWERVFIWIHSQPNKQKRKGLGKEIFRKEDSASSKVLREMLKTPEQSFTVSDLAAKTGVSMGTVSNVKKFLVQNLWAEDHKKSFKLCNIDSLLKEWSEKYNEEFQRPIEYYTFHDIPVNESVLSKWSRQNGCKLLLSKFSAAIRYAPCVNYIRAETIIDEEYLEKIEQDLKLKKVNSGGNILLYPLKQKLPFEDYRLIHDSPVTSPVQMVIDLYTDPARGEEAAQAVVRKMLEKKRKEED